MNYQFWYHPYFGRQHLHTILENYSNADIKEFGKDLIDTNKINFIAFMWQNKLVNLNKIINREKFAKILKQINFFGFYLIADFSGEASNGYIDNVIRNNLYVISNNFNINRFLIIENNFEILNAKEIEYGNYKIKTIHLPYFILSTPLYMKDYIHDLSEYKNIKKKKDFICLNRRVKKHKFLFLRELYNRNLINNTYWTYVSNYVQEDLFKEGTFTKDVGLVFEDFKPIQLQDDVYYGVELDYKDEFLYTINPKWYFESKVNLVVETYNYSPCHITEKVFKPIYLGIPFVVYSSKNYLEKLRNFGFKDYTSIIGEYDCNNITSVIDAGIRLKNIFDSSEVIEISEYNKSLINDTEFLNKILNDTFYQQLGSITKNKKIL